MIRAGLSIGFSVAELADIFSERNSGGAPVAAFGSWLLKACGSSKKGFANCNRGGANCARRFLAWDGCFAKTPRGKQARLLKISGLTRRPMRNIWVAASEDGESYEADSSNHAHSRNFYSIEPEAGIANRVSYARRAYSEE